MSERLSRRDFLKVSAAAGTATLAAGCAPAAAPGAPGGEGSSGAGKAEWERQWEELVAASKQEGQLNLVTTVGAGFKEAVKVFEQTFPGITVDHTSLQASAFAPKALQERKSGVYTYDAITTTYGTVPLTMIPEGAMDPIRPLLFRPDILDDNAWRDGFEAGWLDLDKKWGYAAFQVKSRHLWINTDMVREDEIKKPEDLLNPKWKGRLWGGDPRTHGGGWWPGTILRLAMGDDFLRKLWKDQEMAFSRENRQLAENMFRGRFAIGIGAMPASVIPEFFNQGLGKNLKHVELVLPDGRAAVEHLNAGSDVVYVFSRAPHPNAARLFANWILTKEGQTVWSKWAENNSRRPDVPAVVDPSQLPTQGVKYVQIDKQELEPEWVKTIDLAKAVLN